MPRMDSNGKMFPPEPKTNREKFEGWLAGEAKRAEAIRAAVQRDGDDETPENLEAAADLYDSLVAENLQAQLTAFFRECLRVVVNEGDTNDFLTFLKDWNEAGLNDDEAPAYAMEIAYRIATSWNLDWLIPEDRDSSNQLHSDNIR